MPDAAIFPRKLDRRVFAAAALMPCLVLTCWAFPGQSQNNSMPRAQKNASRHQIDRLENKWRVALLKGDVTALNSLLADDYVAIMSNGTLQTKDQTLQGIRSGAWHFTTLDISEQKIRFYGRTAVVTSLARVEATSPQGQLTGAFRYTRVYARDPRGVWKIVNFEASRLGHQHEPKSID